MKFKEVAICLAELLNTAGMITAVWQITDWGIGRIVFGGMLLSAISHAAIHIGFYMAVLIWEQKRRNRIDRMKLEHRRRAKFRVYDLQGELIEIPFSEGMTEIRCVVGEKKNTLPPTKAMQDVG